MRIQVKQHHIAEGRRGDPQNCAIALAAREAGLVDAHVACGGVICREGGFYLMREYGPEIDLWIRAFDDGGTVPPVTVALGPVTHSMPAETWNRTKFDALSLAQISTFPKIEENECSGCVCSLAPKVEHTEMAEVA
jgi:hypothetical protein